MIAYSDHDISSHHATCHAIGYNVMNIESLEGSVFQFIVYWASTLCTEMLFKRLADVFNLMQPDTALSYSAKLRDLLHTHIMFFHSGDISNYCIQTNYRLFNHASCILRMASILQTLLARITPHANIPHNPPSPSPHGLVWYSTLSYISLYAGTTDGLWQILYFAHHKMLFKIHFLKFVPYINTVVIKG